MGGYYTILGRQIPSHQLAIAFLSMYAAGAVWATSGKKSDIKQGPPINASSNDEDSFIRQFLAEAEKDKATGAASGDKH